MEFGKLSAFSCLFSRLSSKLESKFGGRGNRRLANTTVRVSANVGRSRARVAFPQRYLLLTDRALFTGKRILGKMALAACPFHHNDV